MDVFGKDSNSDTAPDYPIRPRKQVQENPKTNARWIRSSNLSPNDPKSKINSLFPMENFAPRSSPVNLEWAVRNLDCHNALFLDKQIKKSLPLVILRTKQEVDKYIDYFKRNKLICKKTGALYVYGERMYQLLRKRQERDSEFAKKHPNITLMGDGDIKALQYIVYHLIGYHPSEESRMMPFLCNMIRGLAKKASENLKVLDHCHLFCRILEECEDEKVIGFLEDQDCSLIEMWENFDFQREFYKEKVDEVLKNKPEVLMDHLKSVYPDFEANFDRWLDLAKRQIDAY